MSDSSLPNKRNKTPRDDDSHTEESIDELRKLLLGPLEDRLDKLQERLDSPDLHADDVSQVLPEAISLRSSRDKRIEIALEPITERAIRSSIKKDPKVLVDALFPVMGPAIRKAIASALQGMTQSFNQILEHSFSSKGLKWRFEALRTRKPFAEVVLLHTLVYQVEQVFLIHKDTGLVLQHVVGKSVVAQDPDLVSGMLTAIKDFVQDSFGGKKEAALETLRIGERNVWIEQGDNAFLAAVIRGNPPMDLQLVLREAIEEIHFKQRDELESFDGETTCCEEIRYILDNCLQAQFKETQRKRSYFLWILLGIGLILIGLWIYLVVDDHRRWSNYIGSLRQKPGFVVTTYAKKSGKHYISGLRDPLAPDPEKLLQDAGLSPTQAIFQFEPYYSVYPDYAGQRIKDILKPPATVTLEFKDGILAVKGSSLHQWLEETRKLVKLMPWVREYRDQHVVDIDQTINAPETVTIELHGNTLQAYGSASHQWIRHARQSVKSLPGISDFREEKLIDVDLRALNRAKERIEKRMVFFKAGVNEPLSGQEAIIKDLALDINRLISLSKIFDHQLTIELIGHSDSSGAEDKNIQLSNQRAEIFRMMLISEGVSANLTARGVGSQTPFKEEIDELDRAYNRRVTLRVHLVEKPQ
jgi:OOP family OmpA-OmpF porin